MLWRAGAGGVYFWLAKPRPAPEPPPADELQWTVEAWPLVRRDVQPTLEGYGQVTAQGIVELRPPVAGRVVEVAPGLADGRVVTRGELLFSLDPFVFEQRLAEAEADYRAGKLALDRLSRELAAEEALRDNARKTLVVTERERRRLLQLRERGAVQATALDEAERNELNVQRTLLTHRQTIQRLAVQIDEQGVELERLAIAKALAADELAKTAVRAPMKGVLLEPQVGLGQAVNVGDALGQLWDPGQLEVRLRLSEGVFARLQAHPPHLGGGVEGRPVTVVWRRGGVALDVQGTIDRLAGQLDAAAGTVDVFVRLEEATTALPLRPGTFVGVVLADVVYPDVYALPPSAITDRDEVYAIVTHGEVDRLARFAVDVVRRRGERWLVRGDLPRGGRVVRRQFRGIGPGLKVEVVTGPAADPPPTEPAPERITAVDPGQSDV
ncbi:MAG: efflux RND transporter periplasmic adaptor subunit [Candidatus Competibacterales bacterium]